MKQKHIILSLLGDTPEFEELFGKLEPDCIPDFFWIRPEQQNDDQIFQNIYANCAGYDVGKNADWYDVFYYIDSEFLQGDKKFVLDVLINDQGCGRALEILRRIEDGIFRNEQMPLTRIFFLANVTSKYPNEEQKLYDDLKQGYLDHNMDKDVPWVYWYLLMAENAQQTKLRKWALPFLLCRDINDTERHCKTCVGTYRELDSNPINRVPMDLAVKAVCNHLTKEEINGMSALLMGDGIACYSQPEEQKHFLEQKLLERVPIKYPSAWDLIVHKGHPDAEVDAEELLNRFWQDNPDEDIGLYTPSDTGRLEALPLVAGAADEWEKSVVSLVCQTGGIQGILDLLKPESAFDSLLQSDSYLLHKRRNVTLNKQCGYSDEAAERISDFIETYENDFTNAVTQARFRLIRYRIKGLAQKLTQIETKRREAIKQALTEISTESLCDTIPGWVRKIELAFADEISFVRYPDDHEDIGEWIQKQARALLNRTEIPDFDEAHAERGKNGEAEIQALLNEQPVRLLTTALSGTINSLTEKLYVSRQLMVRTAHVLTEQPLILRLQEGSFEPDREGVLDTRLFRRIPGPRPVPVAPVAGTTETKPHAAGLPEHPLRTGSRMEQDTDEIPIFDGKLSWKWVNTAYQNAEITAYTENEEELGKCKVQFRPDDHYPFALSNKMPSGAKIIFKVQYFKAGRPTGEFEEIVMRMPRMTLEVSSIDVKAGGKLFGLGANEYRRLKIVCAQNSSFLPEHVAVASSRGYAYTARWTEEQSGCWLSELLPVQEEWHVIDRPGDLSEYEIIDE